MPNSDLLTPESIKNQNRFSPPPTRTSSERAALRTRELGGMGDNPSSLGSDGDGPDAGVSPQTSGGSESPLDTPLLPSERPSAPMEVGGVQTSPSLVASAAGLVPQC